MFLGNDILNWIWFPSSIRQLQEDIEMLKREKAKKDEAFEERKRNFSGFISNIKELQQTIERERAEGVSQ